MKILLICKALPLSFKGGIQTHVWALSRELLRLGHEVSILTGGSILKAPRTSQLEGRTIHEIPHIPGRIVPFIPRTVEELSFNLAAWRWLRKHQEDFDIIHAQGRSGVLFPSNRKKCGVALTIHRLFAVENQWGRKEYYSALDRFLHPRITHLLEGRSIKNTDALIGVSRSTIKEMEALFPASSKPARLIYNGTDILPHSGNSQYDPQRLLFVGRLTEVKGIFPLIDGLALVKPHIRLAIVGDGPARKELERKIKEKELEARVQMYGALEADKVRQLMANSYALILPSFHESQGIVLMENNACGRPVLAADTSGIREIVFHQQNGILFPPGDICAMAQAINGLFESPARACAMGRWGKSFIAGHFSWEKIARETINVYESL